MASSRVRPVESQPESADLRTTKRSRLTRSSGFVAVDVEEVVADVQEVSSDSDEPTGEDPRATDSDHEESDDDVAEVAATSSPVPRSPNSLQEQSPCDQTGDTTSTSAADGHVPSEFAGLDGNTRIKRARHTPAQVEFIKQCRRRDKLLERLRRRQETRERRDERREEALSRQNTAELENRRNICLSITVEWSGQHVPQEVFDSLREFLERSSSWWCLSKEKGSTIGLWHCQAVAVFHATSAKSVKKDWIRFAGWHQNPPPYKVNNCFKEVANRGLSTQYGLLGYVRKDIDQYEGHLCVSSESVRDEEKVRGDELYLALGKSDKTADCILTVTNFIDRASLFFDRRIRNPALAELDYVLRMMLQTGKFSIHGSFFTSHGSMIYSRAQTAFQCRVFPAQTSTADVHAILFNRRNAIRDETLDNLTAKSVDRDGPDDFDPFSARSAYVTLDRSLQGDAEQCDARCPSLSDRDTTEARSNADARPPPSMYETLQRFAEPQPDTDPCEDPPSSERTQDYSETAWDIAGDVTRRLPTPQQLRDPRMPEFFVHRSAAPGLNRPVYSRFSSNSSSSADPPAESRNSSTGQCSSSISSPQPSSRRRHIPQSDSD